MSRDVVFDESASWYTFDSAQSNPVEIKFDIDAEEEDQPRPTLEVSPISTGLGGPKEPPSHQNTSRPSLKQDKRKAKMHEYEDSDGNELTHSLDSQCDGLDVPIMRTPEATCRSTREKKVVIRFGYNDHMAYHYAFMMKLATIREPKTFSEAAKDPRWLDAMNEEMQALSKNETWDLVPSSPHQKAIGCRWIFIMTAPLS